jgi:hypothetical protein
MDDKSRIKFLEEELEGVKAELQKTKEHLKRYTAPGYKKEYYEKNKEEHIKRVREYQKRTEYKNPWKPTPEQKRESNRRAYLKRKEKAAAQKEEADENIEEV